MRQRYPVVNCTSVCKEKLRPDSPQILATKQIDNFLITLPQPGSFPGWGMVLCAVAKGVMCMQKQLLTSDNTFKRTDGRWNGVVWYMDEQRERKRKSLVTSTWNEG